MVTVNPAFDVDGSGNLAVVNSRREATSINIPSAGRTPRPIKFLKGWSFTTTTVGSSDWVGYGVKNLFELKPGVNVVATGNTVENNYADAQSGISVLFTVRGRRATAANHPERHFQEQSRHNTAGCVNILPSDHGQTSTEARNIQIEHNRFLNVGGRALMPVPQSTGGGQQI